MTETRLLIVGIMNSGLAFINVEAAIYFSVGFVVGVGATYLVRNFIWQIKRPR